MYLVNIRHNVNHFAVLVRILRVENALNCMLNSYHPLIKQLQKVNYTRFYPNQ